ncbi:MAG: twin arginine-targeting protein translocase TatB [Caulobacter sp. 12-67-6]|nr:MAG: twin arginine-targeting protein translocase TatB [Caulobacter sp. 12-67-6]OYX72538.1 MAG: twin arginine-targeting protein translocase TatB [Caulobacter sp. 32-67-35]OYX94587.1 MAG: twin arginine-targeting protein translocase TatB [Caulobacter sp. 35-67-4]HQR89877.1 Sec-independent protein translocase protein TatB [Caulobacter sp.]
MLPDIGGAELLVIAAVALIVVGPKDLPLLLRKLGQFVGKMRGMASEFRASFDEMARQSELDDLRREVEAMRSGQYTAPLREAADQAKDVGVDQVFADIDASLNSGAVQVHPYAGYQPNDASSEPSILPPETVVEPVAAKPRTPRKPRAAKAPMMVEPAPAKAPARKRAAKTEIAVEAPKAARAPRKKAVKAGGSTASDIIS